MATPVTTLAQRTPPPGIACHAPGTCVCPTRPRGAFWTARHAPALPGPTNSHTALRGLPCQHCTASRRAAGLRERSQAMSSPLSRSRASTIERAAAGPSRDGSTEPVAP
jgi:hypothetical protein